MIDRKSKEGNTSQKEIDEYLANGGKITICPPGERTEDIGLKGMGFYGRKKKPQKDTDKK